MAKVLTEYLEQPTEQIDQGIHLVYRVNSVFAQKRLPRNIIIQFVTIRKKEEILWKQFYTPLEIDEKTILILKELPKKALLLHKNYKKLTDYITESNINFRWKLPEGLTFIHRVKRLTIRTL